MHTLTKKRVSKFSRDYGFEDLSESDQFERYVAANYLHKYIHDDPDLIDRCVLGGGGDEGVDIAAVIVNGSVMFEPSDIQEAIGDQQINTARIVFIQAKTSTSFDSKLISKFLHGVESITQYALDPTSIALPPRLADIALMIESIVENGDKFNEMRTPCDLFYVTTSNNDGKDSLAELQVTRAIDRIRDTGVYADNLEIKTQGHEDLSSKQKERFGPQNIKFRFERNQALPATDRVSEAYIGLIPASELMILLCDESGEVRPGIFEDNVRLDLGAANPVNGRIMGTLTSPDRDIFPYLNNGLTVIARELRNAGEKFIVSGYQIVNGGQTSHQIMRWANSPQVRQKSELLRDVWVPLKIVSSQDPEVRSSVTIATNLQTAISATDIQSSSQIAKEVEEYFSQSGSDGLRYQRQSSNHGIDFTQLRVVTTPDLNRAVAATLFGQSSKAIGSPKELESADSYVWGDYGVESYYYAAWIMYRVDRYIARTPDVATLRAARYHMAMLVSAIVNPKLKENFSTPDIGQTRRLLESNRGVNFKVSDSAVSDAIEAAIVHACGLIADHFATVLAEGRSLRKDDVRSLQHQETLLKALDALGTPL